MGANGCHAYPSHLRFGGQSLSRVLVQRRAWGQEGAETGPPRGAWGRGAWPGHTEHSLGPRALPPQGPRLRLTKKVSLVLRGRVFSRVRG